MSHGTAYPLDYVNPVSASESTCQDGTTCDSFILNVSGTQADWAGKQVHVQIDWTSPTFDYALSVHKGTTSDPITAYSDNAIDSPRNYEAVDIDPSVSGVGQYTVHVIYFTTSSLDTYKGTVSATVKPAGTPTPTPPPGLDRCSESLFQLCHTERTRHRGWRTIYRRKPDDRKSFL